MYPGRSAASQKCSRRCELGLLAGGRQTETENHRPLSRKLPGEKPGHIFTAWRKKLERKAGCNPYARKIIRHCICCDVFISGCPEANEIAPHVSTWSTRSQNAGDVGIQRDRLEFEFGTTLLMRSGFGAYAYISADVAMALPPYRPATFRRQLLPLAPSRHFS